MEVGWVGRMIGVDGSPCWIQGFTVSDQTLTFGALGTALDANVLLVSAAATGIAAARVAGAAAVGAAAGGLLGHGGLRHRWPF
jgi:hypothetical protein